MEEHVNIKEESMESEEEDKLVINEPLPIKDDPDMTVKTEDETYDEQDFEDLPLVSFYFLLYYGSYHSK